MKDGLTVIIPVFNAEQYLRRCINSIKNQSYKKIDIIVIDDASTDRSLEIIKKIMVKYNNIFLIHLEKNSGVAVARNIGLKKVKTKYVSFIDPDDWIDINTYEKAIIKMSEDNSDIAIFGIRNEYENNYKSSIRYEYSDNFIDNVFSLEVLSGAYEIDFDISTIANNRVYSTKLLRNNGIKYPKIKCYEDNLFSFKTLYYSQNISLISGVNYHYFQRNESLMHIIDNDHIKAFFSSCELIYRFLCCYQHDYLFCSYFEKALKKLLLRLKESSNNLDVKNELFIHIFNLFRKTSFYIYIIKNRDLLKIDPIK